METDLRNKDLPQRAQCEEGELPDYSRPTTLIDDNLDREENMKLMFSNNNDNFR